MRLSAMVLGCSLALLPAMAPADAAAGLQDVHYYYHGHSYRYHWHGGYYNYYWHGRYYRSHYRCGPHWCYR